MAQSRVKVRRTTRGVDDAPLILIDYLITHITEAKLQGITRYYEGLPADVSPEIMATYSFGGVFNPHEGACIISLAHAQVEPAELERIIRGATPDIEMPIIWDDDM